jgi:hypothetical protein
MLYRYIVLTHLCFLPQVRFLWLVEIYFLNSLMKIKYVIKKQKHIYSFKVISISLIEQRVSHSYFKFAFVMAVYSKFGNLITVWKSLDNSPLKLLATVPRFYRLCKRYFTYSLFQNTFSLDKLLTFAYIYIDSNNNVNPLTLFDMFSNACVHFTSLPPMDTLDNQSKGCSIICYFLMSHE